MLTDTFMKILIGYPLGEHWLRIYIMWLSFKSTCATLASSFNQKARHSGIDSLNVSSMLRSDHLQLVCDLICSPAFIRYAFSGKMYNIICMCVLIGACHI